jgi:hypothetical protein
MRHSLVITLLALALGGCSKRDMAKRAVPSDPLGRFIAESTNLVGSFPFHNTGVPILKTVQKALSKTYDGQAFYLQPYHFTNLDVLEVRTLDSPGPQPPFLLKDSVLMLVQTPSGQKVVQFEKEKYATKDERTWWYHVYDLK